MGNFLNIIRDKWIDTRLWEVKKMTARVMSFSDDTYESEKLKTDERPIYWKICNASSELTNSCTILLKSDLLSASTIKSKFTPYNQYTDIESYLNDLSQKLKSILEILESLSIKPDKPNRYINTMKLIMEHAEE